jgi:hypothetical protein
MAETEQSLRDRGVTAFREGRTDEAVRLLQQAVAADPRDQRAYSVLGAAHMQRGEYEDAVSTFEKARSIRPDAAHIHFNLGLACQRAGHLEQAIAAFQAAAEVDPTYDKAKEALSRARAAHERGQSPRAAAEAPPSAEQPPAPGMPTAPPRRMPVAPPPAPWQTPVGGPQSRAPQSDVELRPLGGPLSPASPAGAPDGPGAPPRAPWQTEQGLPPPRSSSGAPETATRGREPSSKDHTNADYRRVGFKVGMNYGILFIMPVAFFDRYIEGKTYGLIGKIGVDSFLMLLIGAAVTGAMLGGLIGLATGQFRSPGAGIGVGVGVCLALAIFAVMRAGGIEPTIMMMGIGMGAGYGLLMGWAVSRNVMVYIKRL